MQTANKLRIKLLIPALGVLLALSLAACSQDNNRLETSMTKAPPTETVATVRPTNVKVNTPTTAPTSTPTATPEPISQIGIEPGELEGVNISFWHTLSGEAETVVGELVDQFNNENEWGIQVRAENRGTLDQMHSSISSAIESGEMPDLATGYLYQALEWDQGQVLVDLNLYTEDSLWGLDAGQQADYFPAFWEHDFYGDKRVGIPFQRSAEMLYYNISWAFELGFSSAPTTTDELREQACAAARANQIDDDPANDGTGGLIISTNYSTILGWLSAAGANVSAPNSASQGDAYEFDNPQVEETFHFLREQYDDGCAWIAESAHPDEAFANRQGLFASGNLTDLPYQADAFNQAGNDDQWTVIPFPSPAGDPAINVYGPSLVMFSSNDAQQLAAWLFARWLVKAENHTMLVESGAGYPLSASSVELLQDSNMLPQWHVATELLEYAHPEPTHQSWNLVRWAVFDAATQLFRYYFTIDQVPELVKFLHQTANDLHEDPLQDSAIQSYRPTPETTAIPTGTMTEAAQTQTVTPTP